MFSFKTFISFVFLVHAIQQTFSKRYGTFPLNRPALRYGLRFGGGMRSGDPRFFQPRGGPNRCQGGVRCCPGWTQNPSTGLCTVPLCRNSCGVGYCRSPNLCQCMNGNFGVNCVAAVCTKACMNNGKCVGPNKCRCLYGFSGDQCEIDYRVGPCFTRIEDNMCRAQLIGVKCTRESCCSSVGVAWGVPCEKCPQKRECERGFYKNVKTGSCEDMNECRGIPNICAMGTCINTIGSYRCECGPGRTYNQNKLECIDVDECSANKRLCEFGKCENLDGSFKCNCNRGFKAINNGKQCVANNIAGRCYSRYDNGRCTQQIESSNTKKSCCCGSSRRGFATDRCEQCPTRGSALYRALGCPDDGSEGGQKENDRCNSNTDLCKNGNCVNQPDGRFKCVCNKGYESTENQQKCVAMENLVVCYGDYSGGRCLNKAPGKHSKSKCCCGNQQRAFSNCQKCPLPGTDAYKKLGCPDDEGGIDNNGKGASMKNQTTEKDGDKECNDIFEKCQNGECESALNRPLFCKCKPGFQKNQDNYCEDKNECVEYDGFCHGGKCVNTVGSFKCNCPVGYTQSSDKFSCEDIDECIESERCGPGVCKNFPGTFQCRCNKGYVTAKDRMTCVDRNECEDSNICLNSGNCTNTEGSYSCDCTPGYMLNDDKVCVDINECETMIGICQNGHCMNTGGSFKCICPAGYELTSDGKSCNDRNECTYIKDVCKGGQCVNGPGSYRCRCSYGYKVSDGGTSCIDVRVENCYIRYDGFRCEMPLSRQLTKTACCCGMESTGRRAWGKSCNGCPKKGNSEYNELCKHGSGVDGHGNDINECRNNAGTTMGICSNGRCENLHKDYKCACNSGYKNNKDSNKICEDINECTEFDICKGGSCENTNGRYTCTCPNGYHYNYVTKTCEDKDECEANPCRGGTCTNTLGSFKCICPSGSVYDSATKMCKDNRQGSCYGYVDVANKCQRQVARFVSKSECCNGVGRAWGINTCEVCGEDSGLGCTKGYKRVGEICVDIDECQFNGICVSGTCINTKGNFYCQCPKGFEVHRNGRRCIDKRAGVCFRKVDRSDVCTMPIQKEQFKKANCCCSGFSQAWGSPCERCPQKGSADYNELCPMGSGYHENGADVNECKIKDMCKDGRCINTKGSFKCVCNSGFDLDETGTICVDINECSISKGICGPGTCINERGGFRCECKNGYRNHMMLEKCVDINECMEMKPSPCRGGQCINTQGSFRCDCPKGMRTLSDASSCEDIDECAEIADVCPNGLCQNFIGGYHCRCEQGFRESNDMLQCLDINECSVNKGGCEYSCTNTPGNYKCGCRPGYELRADRKTCTDVNECLRGRPCGIGNECTNTIGGHICTCTMGYRPSADAKACIDVDECTEDPSICQNGECINTAGSFLCRCRLGYKLEPSAMACLDIDECKVQPNGGCHPDARCLNNVGSFTCTCKAGYEGNGQICNDVDECARGLATCAPDADCKNTVGSFECQCKQGFKGDGEFCLDNDECKVDENICQPGTCTNTIGAYQCTCPAGFEPSGDGMKCLDKNECLNEDVCDHGYCINTVGSYTCQCERGYQLDKTKTQCTDVNECSISGMCPNGVCENMMGKYRCVCDRTKGFMPNQNDTGCTDMRMGHCYSKFTNNQKCGGAQLTKKMLMKQFCCCTAPEGSAWEETESELCESCPSMTSGGYKSLCPGGVSTHVNETTNKITKHDGCVQLPNYCAEGTCEDKGNYGISCLCPNGYQFNTQTFACEDLNECLTDGICGYGAQCINLKGSYKCQCPDNYVFNRAENFCEDLRNYSCFSRVLNPVGECSIPLKDEVTIGKCCCGIPGGRFGPDCKSCPGVGTGQRYALCIGKPVLPVIPTGEPPIGKNDTIGTGDPDTGTDGGDKGRNKTGGIVTTATSVATLTTTAVTAIITTTIDPRFDIDECVYFKGICEKGKCMNTIGSYQCDCDQGFEEGVEGMIKKCLDINECLDSPCENGICNNMEGAFYCSCVEGLRLDESNFKCVDLDECNTVGYCEDGNCTNLLDGDGFECDCHEGFVKTTNGKSCEDMDECLMPDICTNGKCINKPGGYSCECNKGYRKDLNGKCVDVDECVEYPNLCNNGRCNNVVGSYFCKCNAGFKQDNVKQSCLDIDECKLTGYCENGRCTNKVGSAQCKCNDGFEKTSDGRSCKDIDECSLPDAPCQFGGNCINMVGKFKCTCNSGFVANEQITECIDVRRSVCYSRFKNGKCSKANGRNTTKSMCCCSLGAGWGAKECDKCPKKDSKEFKYYCPNGVGRTRDNRDINECETNMAICTNGNCLNTDGSFRCDCNKGYTLNPQNPLKCIDLNECTATSNICGSGKCTNVVGTYTCACERGFRNQDNSPSCEDINECIEQPGLCAFRCKNLPGSYLCTCPRGFKLSADGKHCEDVNECNAPDRCPFFCKNLVGSYRCICPPGFKGDGINTCVEINECSQDATLCQPGGRCQNVEGSYRCVCTPPFMRSTNGKFCEDKRLSYCFSNAVNGVCQGGSRDQMVKVGQRDCCCSGGGVAWGRDCRSCPDLNDGAGESLCAGYQNKSINECSFIAGVCRNGKCLDMPESFRCMCNDGYKLSLDGKSCYDMNECEEGRYRCPGDCKNTDGSYECVCPKGYVINALKTKCIDENECETGNHNCKYRCENTEGSFTCSCPDGYNKQGGDDCKDINECEDPKKCGQGTCRNKPGSYECVCGQNSKLDKDKKTCVSIIDETGGGTDKGTGEKCTGAKGCGCPPGYYPYFYFGQMQCVDINECRQNACGDAPCINTLGSYQCTCQQGFVYQNGVCGDINECLNNPCSYGCSNNRGGFACQCPQGWSASNGGHCVATRGVSCFSCDTSDIPSEGVPLSGTSPPQTFGSHQSAVGTGSVPLISATSNPKYHFDSRELLSGTGLDSSFTEDTKQDIFGGGGGGGDGGDVGFSDGGDTFEDFNPYGSRKRRSLKRRISKAIDVKVSWKAKTNTTVIKLSPMLKAMLGHMDYEITHGNSTLFGLKKDARGRASVYTIGHLERAKKYTLTVQSKIVDTKNEIEHELREIYHGDTSMTYKFNIRSL